MTVSKSRGVTKRLGPIRYIYKVYPLYWIY
jgi:hypothetical protein